MTNRSGARTGANQDANADRSRDLAVIGATSRTGTHLVAQAADRGYRITALTRRPEALSDPTALARIVAAEGRDSSSVRSAISGADVVIAIIGATSRRGPHQSAEVARVLIQAMAVSQVRRLVITSAYPLVADKPRLPLAILRRVLAEAYNDLARMERDIADSDLDWTIARFNRLTDSPAKGNPRISTGLLDRPSPLTRADAATALLDITERRYRRVAVNIAGPPP